MLKKFALYILKPYLEDWLTNRALVLPASQRAIIAHELDIPEAKINALQAKFQAIAISQIEKL